MTLEWTRHVANGDWVMKRLRQRLNKIVNGSELDGHLDLIGRDLAVAKDKHDA